MPGIRTSAITYRRGISNNTPNFFLFAQANYVIPQPTNRFRQNNVVSVTQPYAPPPNTTILVYNTPQPSSFTWSGVSFTLNTSLPNYSYTAITTSIPASTVPFSNNLTGVTIGNSVTSIGQYAFQICPALTSVTIGNSVTTIGDYAFNDCPALISVTIPNSVTTIGTTAFQACTSLTSITIPPSVTTIGDYAFTGCTSLINIVVNSYLSNFGYGFFGLNNAGLQINFNYSGIIPVGACNGRTLMTGVTIGNQITSIGQSAFQSCSNLTSIIIPNSVTSIGTGAFTNCSVLATVYISNATAALLGKASGFTWTSTPSPGTSIPTPQFYNAPNNVRFILPP